MKLLCVDEKKLSTVVMALTFRFNHVQLYTRKVQLNPEVNLRAIAASCNGFVGADLEALCREAAMAALQRSSGTNENAILCMTTEDWKHARSIVGPSMTRGVTVEVPNVTWNDIGGLKDLKVCMPRFFSVCFSCHINYNFLFIINRKSYNNQSSGLSNMLLLSQSWVYRLHEGFFCMGLQVAPKQP